jgi:predicted O-methyltransferase YrrM
MTSVSARIKRKLSRELTVFMDSVEFSQLSAVIAAVAPSRCLEWGSGGSTKAILQAFPFVERYVSIEHDPDWYSVVEQAIADPRLALHLVESDVPRPSSDSSHDEIEAWDRRAETDEAMMRSYVGFPSTLGELFDFILVDGRARSLCLRAGYELLKPGGVMLLHDAHREDYKVAIASFDYAIKLEPWKQGQICLIKKRNA